MKSLFSLNQKQVSQRDLMIPLRLKFMKNLVKNGMCWDDLYWSSYKREAIYNKRGIHNDGGVPVCDRHAAYDVADRIGLIVVYLYLTPMWTLFYDDAICSIHGKKQKSGVSDTIWTTKDENAPAEYRYLSMLLMM